MSPESVFFSCGYMVKLKFVAVHRAGQVVQVVARCHGLPVGAGGLDGQQVAARGERQGDVFVEHIGGLAGGAHDGVALLAGFLRGDVLDIVIGAVQGGPDELGHAAVHDDELAPGGRGLVEEDTGDELAAFAHDGAAELEVHFLAAHLQMRIDDGENRCEIGHGLRGWRLWC